MLYGAAASSGPSAEILSLSAADQQEDALTYHRGLQLQLCFMF